MLRSLIHYWRVNLAVLLGAAVATAVLAGALLVGDSVKGSLRDLTLDRLGGIDHALVSARFLRADLADDLAAAPGFDERFASVAPAIVVRGSALHDESGARASKISIQGVDERFVDLYPDTGELDFGRRDGQIFPSVYVNAALSRELGVEAGDDVLLYFTQFSDIPRDTLMGEKETEDVVGTLRGTVVEVLPDRGIGRFGLLPNQGLPLNAFVSMRQLQRALGRRGEINTLLVADRPGGDDPEAAAVALETALASALDFSDLGLAAEPGDGFVRLESREFVLRPNLDAAVSVVARDMGVPLVRVQSYVANKLTAGDRLVPYSLVVGFDPDPAAAWSSLVQVDGTPVSGIGDDEIWINSWTADQLGVAAGDTLTMDYFEVGPREELIDRTRDFTVGGVVAIEGAGADATLTPEYPGIQDAEDMAAWDPPFEVDLSLIRDEDEDYWDDYGAVPKAFVSTATAKALWSTRFGSTTSARIGAPDGTDAAAEALRAGLLARMSPEAFHLQFQSVKSEGLAAAQGATDFGMLFVSFSFFLIISSAMIVGLLFGLNVEQRARQIGLLLAVGYPVKRVRRELVGEGLVLAGVGGLLGLAGGVGYAALLMAALRTLWVGAVGSSELYLHINPVSLPVGWAIAVAVVGFSIFQTVKRLRRIPPPQLLAGSLRSPQRQKTRRITPILAWGGLAVALGLVGYAFVSDSLGSMGLAFGAGALLMISGLAFFALWCRGSRTRGIGGAVIGMAARNSSWAPGRSILSVALVASACFVIVLVAANRHEFGRELEDRGSGAGGYALIAEAEVPLYQDLNEADGRAELGFSADDAAVLDRATVAAFRFRPGDDASCLNLYQPEKPRLLGVPGDVIARGGFGFKQVLLPEDPAARAEIEANPWRLLERPLEDGAIPMIGDANSMQWILKLRPGQDLVLENEYGEPMTLRLVATLDRSVFQSELLVAESAFLENFPGRSGYAFFLVDTPFDGATEVATTLEAGLAPYGFDSSTTADKLAAFQTVEHTYLSTFQMLGGLGLLLGTAGLAVILVRNVVERRGELATLRAFGFRQSRLGWMVVAENAFLLIIGMVVGTVAAILAVAPRLASVHVPWTPLVATLVGVLAFGMLSSIAAVVGAMRTPLLPALKAER